MKPCLTCGTPSRSAYCPDHGAQGGDQAKGYFGRHWQAIRAARMRLASRLCEYQLPGCTHQATTVHLNPALAGDHHRATLHDTRAACRPCHRLVEGQPW